MTPPKSKVEIAHEHCWHGTGVRLCSNPPQSEEICCECGEKRYLRVAVPVPEGKHGKFAPFNNASFQSSEPVQDKRRLSMSMFASVEDYKAAKAKQAAMQAQRVPTGWALVPIEPTPEMIAAGEREHYRSPTNINPWHKWKAMIAAAPSVHNGEVEL